MDNKLILAKCITLLYRENLLLDKVGSSVDMVRTVLDNMKTSESNHSLNTEKDIIDGLKTTLLDMCDHPSDQPFDKSDLIQRIRINVGDDDKLYNAIADPLNEEFPDSVLKRSITNTKKNIINHFNKQRFGALLRQASMQWNFNNDEIKDPALFFETLKSQLEPLLTNAVAKDPGIIDELDLGDTSALNTVLEKTIESNSNQHIYRTGWQGLNEMLQGGFRQGEYWLGAAMQHCYKTGQLNTLASHICLYNKPLMANTGKKPMLLIIAAEDSTHERLAFLYRQLKFNETREFVSITDVSTEEMGSYIVSKLQVNGWHVRLLRADGGKWTYLDICNRITYYESQGYVIEACFIDYLHKFSRRVNQTGGPIGDDVLDQHTRMRTFTNTKGIFTYTPHQLSKDCKMLIRGAVTEDKLVQALVGRGYYQGSMQLDQIPDGILLSHKFEHNGKYYYAIQRDRHRISSILPESKKYILMEFPEGMPIPDDIDGEAQFMRKLPSYKGNVVDDMFVI